MSTADSSVNVPGSGAFAVDTSLGVDATSLATVYRQRMVIGDDANFGHLATVGPDDPLPRDPALFTRLAPGNPDISDLRDLLWQLLQVALANSLGTTPDTPIVDRGRQHVTTFSPRATPTNVSGTITAGGTAQLLFQAGGVRGFDLQNQSSSQALGFSWWTPLPVIGNAGTYVLSAGTPGGYYVTPPTLGIFDQIAVYVIGATTAQTFTGSYW